MKTLKAISLILVAVALQSCKTLEIAHAPLGCLSQPETHLSDRLTDEQLDSMSDEVFETIIIHITTYKERLNSQCMLIDKHNQLHAIE